MNIDGAVGLVTGANRGPGRAFGPVLGANGGGALVNMLSVSSFYTSPFEASYSASKAAELALANGVRTEIHHQRTLVVAVHARSWPAEGPARSRRTCPATARSWDAAVASRSQREFP